MQTSEKVRTKLYCSDEFRKDLADGLGLAGVSGFVSFCLDSLMEGGRLPSVAGNHFSSLAKDGALIIAAVGSLQTRLHRCWARSTECSR